MDSITFEIDDVKIQLVNGIAYMWKNGTDIEPSIVLPIDQLKSIMDLSHLVSHSGKYQDFIASFK